MGTSERDAQLSDAAGGHPAHSGLARFALKFFGDVHGATAIEYAMIASMISIAIVLGATTIGGKVTGFFNSVAPYL
jgi:pilus assembly protein Flp/PilA